MPASRWEHVTPADRARQKLRREKRKLLLQGLEHINVEWVDLATAQRLVDAAQRTLFTAMITGRLRRRLIKRQCFVSTDDLRTYLRAKVAA
jgi:hypothetical protein